MNRILVGKLQALAFRDSDLRDIIGVTLIVSILRWRWGWIYIERSLHETAFFGGLWVPGFERHV